MDYNNRLRQIKDMYKDDIVHSIIEPDKDIEPIQLCLTVKDMNSIYNDSICNNV